MSSLGVDDITARFAVVWRNFSADAAGQHIEHAYDEIPRILSPAVLPCVITFPGQSTYNRDNYGEAMEETRPYRCVLFIASATLGNLETGKAGVEPYITPALNYFAARPGLEDDTDTLPRNVVLDMEILNDEGYIISEYPIGIDGNNQPVLGLFHGTAFNFEVKTVHQITYKD